jgi:hypothetical protein
VVYLNNNSYVYETNKMYNPIHQLVMRQKFLSVNSKLIYSIIFLIFFDRLSLEVLSDLKELFKTLSNTAEKVIIKLIQKPKILFFQ